MSLSALILIILAFILIWPIISGRAIEGRRFAYLRRLEEKRKSRVITLIDRRRGVSLFGVPFWEFIDIEDAEEILRAVRLTPKNVPIDLVIHTPGGLALATEQIARTLLGHQAKVTVFVPHYAMSGGTLLALAADEIAMDRRAVLGAVDPQVQGLPAGAVLSVLKQKPADKISDRTYIMADVAQKALQEIRQFVEEMLSENDYDPKAVKRITEALVGGERTHDYPITFTQAKELGLRVSTSMPPEIYGLLRLYPPRRGARSPVQYIPVPYRGPAASHS
jgi:ClpP class serine protease